MQGYKLGSLFDGSGGFPLAGILCGIEPVWASEVEPYPIAVTKSRIPTMLHLGDISKINGAEIEPVDVITFGSPCQDLSVAGKRAGLKHEDNGDEETTRSGLFMEAIRIIKEMREATNGRYPTFAVWENVPGAFSSNKGEDFRIVLEEFIKIKEPTATMPAVSKGGWPYADAYMGDGWSIAYRTFDAQYWGVPQRRRRIYLVADFRGERAHKILFELEGLHGHPSQSGAQGQETPTDAQGGSFADDREGETERLVLDDQGGSQTLRAEMHGNIPCVVYDGSNITSPVNASNPQCGDPCHTISTDSRNYVVYCLQGNGIDRADTAGCNGKGVKEDVSYTLNTLDRHAVAYQDKTGALCARDYKGVGSQYVDEDKLVVEQKPYYIVRRLTPTECARLQGFADKWGHIEPKDDFSNEEWTFWAGVRNTHAAINGKATKSYNKAQMLTWYNKLHNDSNEYKMWGNGIALPPTLYCMQGIIDALEAERCTK